ncbi:MAG: hypothetical protein DRI84_07000 [Bacteroidetes bacterium]|nr:MAG: hypothetical protein DRI84_07000 [Bacteroidota bacterium]
MQVNKFNSYFQDSNTLNTDCVKELEVLVDKYPYFQPAWMLLAKAKYRSNDSTYQNVLANTAARVFCREQLYNFIYEPFEDNQVALISKKVEPKQVSEVSEVEKIEPKPEVEKKLEVAHKPKLPKPILKENGEEVQSKEDLQSIVKERLLAIESDKEKQELEKTKLKQNELGSSKSPVSSIKKARKKDDIIESFIKHNPGINRPKDDEYTEEIEFAKRGLEEHFDFVSETLADIYIKQGHQSKAVKIYKQLILKYPEKSSYFAAQIKKIESQSIK